MTTETLLGYIVTSSGITFNVSCGGDTSKKDFSFKIQESEIDDAELLIRVTNLTLIRDKVDTFELAFPFGITFSFTWNEIGLKSNTVFRVINTVNDIHFSS